MTRAEYLREKNPGYNGLSNDALAKQLENEGFCTHYPGYTCDKGFPEACHKCIRRWLSGRVEK